MLKRCLFIPPLFQLQHKLASPLKIRVKWGFIRYVVSKSKKHLVLKLFCTVKVMKMLFSSLKSGHALNNIKHVVPVSLLINITGKNL